MSAIVPSQLDLTDVRSKSKGGHYLSRGHYRLRMIRTHGFYWSPCRCCGRQYQRAKTRSFRGSYESLKRGRCMPCEVAAEITRRKATGILSNAIRLGLIAPVTGQACADCAAPARDYDHRDYRYPLRVDPVCRRCNALRGPGEPFRSILRNQAAP